MLWRGRTDVVNSDVIVAITVVTVATAQQWIRSMTQTAKKNRAGFFTIDTAVKTSSVTGSLTENL